MKKKQKEAGFLKVGFLGNTNLGMRSKLIITLLMVKVIPIVILTVIAFQQLFVLGNVLRDIAVKDSSDALNAGAVENIERMTTDTAQKVADFLYERDDDLRYLAKLSRTENDYKHFVESKNKRAVKRSEWVLSEDGKSWVPKDNPPVSGTGGVSTNPENNDRDGFHYRDPVTFEYIDLPLYDEVTFIGPTGMEEIKAVASNSNKTNYPLRPERTNVSDKSNTYVKAETYFQQLKRLRPGEIYVSDVIGAYVGSNYIGMYVEEAVEQAADERGYPIDYNPGAQAYAGMENPNGQRFEGIVRWGMPVTDGGGNITGYVTLALNHDHIMEYVDHLTPMNERYTELPNAYEGNYAFIWDYHCRSICHPRHHSITGFDPATGNPEIPWLESSIYDAWQESEVPLWTDFVAVWPEFDNQSRQKTPAAALTKAGNVGLDGRYLNNAPQCTGWMDLTKEGGSGSFYILWSGLYKLTTAAAIPYYTGPYAPNESNAFSKRGFGFVAIGAGLEDFARPATETEIKLGAAINDSLGKTILQLGVSTAVIILAVILIAILIASSLTGSITSLIKGMSRFRSGERQFRFHTTRRDEFGTLAHSFDEMADSIEDSVKNPLSIIDMERRVKYMNQKGLEYCKMTLSEITGTYYGDSSVYPSGTKYCPITALEENREADIFFVANSDRYIRGHANYLLDRTGEKKGYIIESVDVTDMVRKQLQIEQQKRLLDQVFSASPDPIWYMDAAGRYLTVNPRFAAIAGKPAQEFTGKKSKEILPPAIAREFAEHDREALRSDGPIYTEEKIRFADDHEETLESVRTPVFDANGTIAGMLGFARNVTQRVRVESALRSTQIELEHTVQVANRASAHKGEFLARMSHEIRTPMNAIIGITKIVRKKLDHLRTKADGISDVLINVDQIEGSSQHLLGLLNDILDISKIEAGKIELVDEVVDLSKLIDTVCGIIQPRCDEKNIRFVVRADTFSPGTFLCDSLRLRQVLINLLGNAVKFTTECGVIEFIIQQAEQTDKRTLVSFSVRDTGIGMSEQSLSTIFQPFEQGDGNIPRKYGGTGLGLSISRSIVQLFGGDITVESEPGEGSEFSFRIWLTQSESDAVQYENEFSDIDNRFAGKRVLLVDDVELNRMIVTAILENTGVLIEEADDGLVAVEKFKQSEPGYYDIILMDIKMPNMDGYQAASAIRALSKPDARTVPIIALTANAFKEDIDAAIQHGMDAHISKPVEVHNLLKIFMRFLGDK